MIKLNNGNLHKHALNYGIVTGLGLTAYLLVIYVFGMANSNALGNISFVILIVGVIFGIKNYRDNMNDGFIEFGKAFTLGFVICVVVGVISSFFTYIQFKYDPALMDEIMAMTQDKMLNKGLNEDEVELQTKIMQKMMTPFVMAIMYIISMAFWGAILSVIMAAILKRKPPIAQ